jgi:hypothetical protein
LDNPVVTTSAANGSRLLIAAGATAEKLNLRVQGRPGSSVTIRRSPDFSAWTFVQDVFNQTGDSTIEVDLNAFGSPTFFQTDGN